MMGRFALALGAVKGEVGILHQEVAVIAIAGCNRDANAGAAIGQLAINGDRTVKAFLQLVCNGSEAAVCFDLVDQDRKLVTAQTCHHSFRELRGYGLGNLLQQRIARRMAKRIVDHLEIVEVDIGYHQLLVVAAARQGVGKLF